LIGSDCQGHFLKQRLYKILMSAFLLKIGQLSIFVYGFFIALSLVIAITLAKHAAQRSGVDPEKILNLCVYLLLASIFGARFIYVFLNPEKFLADPLEILKIWKGGLVFYGGIITALATGLIYLKKVNLPVWKTADILVPSIVIGHCLAKLGCFLAGCRLGKLYYFPWAVSLIPSESIISRGVPLQPAHLYTALNSLLIFSILLLLRRYKKFDGQLLWVCVLLYGIAGLLIGIFHSDYQGTYAYGIVSVSQILAGLMVVTAVFMLIYRGRKTARIEE
jgi:phosphatidylglycerol:prolipoprotein diacylglycerol transferase